MIVTTQNEVSLTRLQWSADEVYSVAARIIAKLARLDSRLANWHNMPNSEKDHGALFDDQEQMLERLKADIERRVKEYPDWPGARSASLSLTTGVGRNWRKAGRADLIIDTIQGRGAFRLREPDKAYGKSTPDILKAAMAALVEELDPVFGNNDIKVKTAKGELVSYRFNRRLYQHRQFFGWLGYVPVDLPHARVRDAYETIKAGKGTIVVSVPGLFDPADDAQVDKAHRVEMDLASYELLPVIDPNLKS